MTDKLNSFEKIINLMDNAATEGEAQAAANAFRRLLLKENMTEQEIRARLGDRKSDAVVTWMYQAHKPNGWYSEQYVDLLNVVSKHLFVRMLSVSTGSVMLVGRERNIQKVIDLYQSIKSTAARLMQNAKRSFQGSARDFCQSYLQGFAVGLHTKFALDTARMSTQESSLVVLLDKDNEKFISEMFGKTRTKTPKPRTNYEAYRTGHKDAMTYDAQEALSEPK